MKGEMNVAPAFAAKPSVGVAEFRNNSRAHWWYGGLGWDLADMVTNELAALGSMTIVERAKLEPVLREQDLAEQLKELDDSAAEAAATEGVEEPAAEAAAVLHAPDVIER